MHFRSDQPAVSLNGDWRFAAIDGPPAPELTTCDLLDSCGAPVLRALVPGDVALDLHRNGLIEEPFYGMNMAALRNWEHTHFVYWRRFEADLPKDKDAVLVFDGVDCCARIFVNGVLCASPRNALTPVTVADAPLRQGTNDIVVHLSPAVAAAAEHEHRAGHQAMSANWESLHIRKPPHAYGWDIMPRAILGGIWRGVHLTLLPRERFSQVYLRTQGLTGDHASAHLALFFETSIDYDPRSRVEIEIQGACGDHRFVERRAALFSAGSFGFDVRNPHVWWPRGRGEQNLYSCRAVLLRDGIEIDLVTFRHGIRTVELMRTSVTDESGSGEFCFKVNGERLFVMGSNWVPLDAFHSRDIDRVDAAVALTEGIGCNMVRCWGGNVYESDRFYDLCDQAGILVWQDFSMACAIYPHDASFREALSAEARDVVRRLRQHACIALWSGDNECDMSYLWGGLQRDPNSNVLTRHLLPEVLSEEDPTRPYLPSSPYIDAEAHRKGIRYLPEDHLWGPRDYYKSEFYQTSLCHFASEIGYHGCPNPDSIRRFITPERVWPYDNNPEWLLHCTSPVPGVNLFDYRVELMANQIRVLFGAVPGNLEDYAFASQASQAEAKKFFIEMFRTAKWRRTGIIWWNILDGWPQFSDAVVDYYFGRKLAFDTIRTAQQPVLLAFREPENGLLPLVACNDTRRSVSVRYTVHDAASGTALAEGTLIAPPDATVDVCSLADEDEKQRFLTIAWSIEGSAPGTTSTSHYLAGSPPFDLEQYRRWMAPLYGRGTWWAR